MSTTTAPSTFSRAVKHELLKVGSHCVISAVGLATFDKIKKEAAWPIPDWVIWTFLGLTIYRICCIRQHPKKVFTGTRIPTDTIATNMQDYPVARSIVDGLLFVGLFMLSSYIPTKDTLVVKTNTKHGDLVASFGIFWNTLMTLVACRGGFLFMDRICANGKIGKMLGSAIGKEDERTPKLKLQ